LLDNEKVQSREVPEDTEKSGDQSDNSSDIQCMHSCTLAKEDSCIWDSNEIQVLRRAFKATNDENVRLRSELGVLQEDVQKMTVERCAQRKLLATTQQRLHAAETANKRLQMLVNHLKTELDHTTTDLDRLRSVEAEWTYVNGRLQKMQLELSTAHCRHDNDVAAAEAKWLKVLEEQSLMETAVKTQLNNDVGKLVEKVEGLEQQLDEERADHSRTRKCLEHLRVHFSSLPTSDQKSNYTHQDELVHWTY